MLGNSIKDYIAWDNCQPFCSVVDNNTGFFPQNQFLRARSLTCPSLTLRFHPPCTTFVSPLACFELRRNGLFCSLVRCKFCCFLRKAVRNGLSGFTYSAVIWIQTSNIVFEYLYIFVFVYSFQAGALVHVYTDGSVLVTHGGTEMGQGLHTKMVQVSEKMETKEMEEMLGHG